MAMPSSTEPDVTSRSRPERPTPYALSLNLEQAARLYSGKPQVQDGGNRSRAADSALGSHVRLLPNMHMSQEALLQHAELWGCQAKLGSVCVLGEGAAQTGHRNIGDEVTAEEELC